MYPNTKIQFHNLLSLMIKHKVNNKAVKELHQRIIKRVKRNAFTLEIERIRENLLLAGV